MKAPFLFFVFAIGLPCVRALAAESGLTSSPAAPTLNKTSPAALPTPTLANVAYGPDPAQVLDFWQAASDKPTPLVFYIHGGGWVAGDKRDSGTRDLGKYLAAGISVVSINYRFTTEAQVAGVKPPVAWPMHDAARALQFVRSKAHDWNIDKQRIGVSGSSAGGCTTLWLTFHPDMADPKSEDPVARESTKPSCAAVHIAQTSLDPKQMKEWTPNSTYGGHAFGFTDPTNPKARDAQFAEFLAHREELLPWIKEYSPIELAAPGGVPVYMSYETAPALGESQKDPTHTANFGIKLKEKLDQLGVECELVYPGAPAVKHSSKEDFLIEKLLSNNIAAANSAPQLIKPGEIWLDDRGQQINAHGGGILKVGDTWYWFGEYRPKEQVAGERYVSCYSSTDLIHWKFRGLPIDMTAPEGLGPDWVLERPKVYYNEKTKKFVMWMHIDEPSKENPKHYGLARIGIAVCDTVDGKYQWVRTFRPFGLESRDIGQFIDDDGTAYVIFESRPTGGFYIAKLSDDYLDVAEQTCFIKSPMEGGALVHYNGLYYLVASGLSGWSPNANKYATATSLKGPWSDFKDIAPPETKTYRSQSTMLVKVVGSKKTTVIFMGDQWKPATQWDSRYLWMPVEIGDGKLSLPAPKAWTIDVHTGEATE